MTTPAASIIQLAQELLNDTSGVRWPAPELVRYLNDGQLEVARLRPDQKTTTRDETLSAGARQTLANDVQALMDITTNPGSKAAIRKTDMPQLDAVVPGWQALPPATDIVHFMHDLRDPRTFYVFPPASEGQQVRCVVATYPTPVGNPSGPTYAAVTGTIGLPDHWGPTLLNYVMFRAHAKDSEFGGNATEAAAYKALFDAATESQLQSTAAVAPKE